MFPHNLCYKCLVLYILFANYNSTSSHEPQLIVKILSRLYCIIFNTYRELSERVRMDRRRLESAHLRYAVLKMNSVFGLRAVPIDSDIQVTLNKNTQQIFSAFRSRYASKALFTILTTLSAYLLTNA